MSRRPLAAVVCVAVIAVASLAVGIADAAAAGAVVVVNSTGDGAWDGTPGVCETASGNGVCTLRAAFGVANATAGTVIDFAIPGVGVHSIAPGSQLPPLTQSVTVDGTSQPGYSGVPLIELSGSSAGAVPGIDLVGGDSTVRGLDVDRWGTGGILVESDDNTIAGNYVGLAPDGESAAGNATSGVLIFGGSGNTVGGITAADRNVISGNGDKGVQIQRTTQSSVTPATGNVVEGNYVGTNAAGDGPVANALDGISVVWGAQDNTIGGSVPGAGNLVSGNGRVGISAFDTSTGTLIEGDYIGTNAAGNAAIGGNPACGIVLNSAANIVGGSSRPAANVISGNTGCAINDFPQDQTTASGSDVIEGNYIGTNAAGTAAIGGNGQYAIQVASPSNTIGGTTPAAGNVISGNAGAGIIIGGSSATGNAVQGNYIGTDQTRTQAIGNSGDGVLVGQGVPGNTIGGTAPGARNTIAHNTANGVEVNGATGDPIEGNSIFANSGLGIALTLGGNGNEPPPTIVSALTGGSSTTISGTAATGRSVEVFANASCSDPEGAVFLGSVVTSTGNWSLTVPAVAVGNGITATATSLVSDNTSQFSTCQPSQPYPQPTNQSHPPVAKQSYPKLKSRVISKWSVHASYTTVRELAVRALPAGAEVVLQCEGRGCRLTQRTLKPTRHRHYVTLTSLFGRTHLRPTTTVEIDITAPNSIGEVVRYTIRTGHTPKQTRLCLPPSDSHPAACTAS